MKHQQVFVDYWTMLKSSCICLLLAFLGYILLKMIQTIFWLPGYLKNNQKRLEDIAAQYSIALNDDVQSNEIDDKNDKIMEEIPSTGEGTKKEN